MRSLLLALALLVVATPLRADPAGAARDAFKAGVAAFQGGDYQTALAKFREAEAHNPAPAITYNIARTLEALFSETFSTHYAALSTNFLQETGAARAEKIEQLVHYLLSIDDDEPTIAIPPTGPNGGSLCSPTTL